MNATPNIVIATAEEVYKDSPKIETITGRTFDFSKPTFDVGEIAHALGNMCRYAGHCRRFYSVAEHSVLVSRIMEDLRLGDPMEGLFHDGVEAYLPDIASPVKALLADYRKLDKALDRKMRIELHLPEEKTPGCTKADWLALFLEAKALMPSMGKGAIWMAPPGIMEEAWQLPYAISCYTPENATSRFMDRMTDVRRRMKGLR